MAVVEPNVFEEKVAYDPFTGASLRNAEADIYAQDDTGFTTPLPLTDLSGVPLLKLTASDDGIFPPFKVDEVTEYPVVIAKSGSFTTTVRSLAGLKGDPGDAGPAGVGVPELDTGTPGQVIRHNGTEAIWSTEAVGGGGGGISSWNDLTDKPLTFVPAGHNHPASQIQDATTVGRAVIMAATAQAARTAMGAGTGNGTSDLTLGTSATTAAPGNHAHGANALSFTPAGGVTATNVQDAIVQAAATGGGGAGTNDIITWDYASGQYPALPVTKPAGAKRIYFAGPVQPTNANVSGGFPVSWIGYGSTQVKPYYDYNPYLA